MPSVSDRQRRFFGAELRRKRRGRKTRTGLSEKKLGEFASKDGSSGSSLFSPQKDRRISALRRRKKKMRLSPQEEDEMEVES